MVQYSPALDRAFAAVADPTRRGILEQLARRDASITDLAEHFEMSLTGIKKHVRLLEDAGLVRTQKAGRVRTCRIGPNTLSAEVAWMQKYQSMMEQRLDHLEKLLERTKGEF
ncbi:MAG TPA: metalloregulator ArsR/SmtB family transcription factor [Gemmatimonadaceae bacterium]|nr:metalloregulator ArsR/SmtB family transcription factor [Gemmatimonadaceae bacterium]